MSKETLVFIFGILVFLSPFMGLPREYKEWLLFIIGGLLMIIGYRLRRHAFLRSLEDGNGGKKADEFIESSVIPATGAEEGELRKQELHV